MRYHAERGNDQRQGLRGQRGGLETRSVLRWRYHSEHGNDQWQGLWGPRGGLKTRSVSGCVTTRSVGSVINFVFGHNMSQRCMYADQKETGPRGPA